MPKTQKSEETKRCIMKSAYELFQKKGFEKTTVKEITDTAGYAKGTFYLYFETKFSILEAFALDFLGTFAKIIKKHLGVFGEEPFRQIDFILDDIISISKEQICYVKMFHTSEILNLISEEAAKEMFYGAVIGPIEQFLEIGIEKRLFRQVDPVLYAKLIVNIAHELLETAMMHEDPAGLEVVNKELKVILRKIIKR